MTCRTSSTTMSPWVLETRDTKTRQNPARSNLDIVTKFKNPWSIARFHSKWRRRQLLKMAGFSTLKGSWPWPCIGSCCIPSCITHRPLPTCQISLKSKELFVDVRTTRLGLAIVPWHRRLPLRRTQASPSKKWKYKFPKKDMIHLEWCP